MSTQRTITGAELREAARGRWIEILRQLAPEISDAIQAAGSTRHFPCPIHGGDDGFRLYADVNETGGGVCNSCGTARGGIDLLIWLKGWMFDRAASEVAQVLGFELAQRKRGRPKNSTPSPAPVLPVNRVFREGTSSAPPAPDQQNVAKEIAIVRAKLAQRWQQATIDRGRLLEYFRFRGIASTPVPTTLRLVEWLPYYSEDPSGALTPAGAFPAMVAQVTHPALGLVAIHRTWLSPTHHGKADVAPAKKLTSPLFDGACRGAAIRLYPPNGDTLAIAEGIETALAVHEAIGIPTWSTISAGGMGTVELPPGIRNVEIWADPGAAGQDAAAAAAERFVHEGRAVKIITPADESEDWLDVLVRAGSAALETARADAEPINPASLPPPEIMIRTAEHEVGDEAVHALARDESIYQRSGMLVHITRDTAAARGIVRPANAPRITPLPIAKLRERLTAVARWVRPTSDGKEPAHPPQWAIQAVAARGEWEGIRHLEGVAETPVLSPDGTIASKPGYHERTGLQIELAGEFPPVPQNPTLEDAQRALAELLDVVVDFPFATPAHQSAWIASLLTPLARFAFSGPAPLFLVDANVRGAGKSLLCDLVGLIFNGRDMARATNTGDDDAEMRKRITAIALAGDPVVLLDNVADVLGTPSLDAALTASTWTDRVLGKSETTQSLPMLSTWYATGNNVVLGGDITRRICHIRIESPEENPEERQGFAHPEIRDWVRGERKRLVVAGLTVLRAFCAAGRPSQNLKPWGSFEGWSAIVRQSIVWAGMADPGETRSELNAENDSEANFLRNLIAGIGEIDPLGAGIESSEILRQLNYPLPDGMPDSLKSLRNAISELGRGGKLPSAITLGRKLNHAKGRYVGGKCLRSMRNVDNATIWFIATAKPSAGDTGDTGDKSGYPTFSKIKNDLPLLTQNVEGAGNNSGISGISGAENVEVEL